MMEPVLRKVVFSGVLTVVGFSLSACATNDAGTQPVSTDKVEVVALSKDEGADAKAMPVATIDSSEVGEIVDGLSGISVEDTVRCGADLEAAYSRLNSIEWVNPFGWKKEKRERKSVQYANAAKVVEAYFERVDPSEEEISAAQSAYSSLAFKRNAADQFLLRNINHQFYKRADKCVKKFGLK